MIDLAPEQLAIVHRLLAAHVPECEVRAFGSRVSWTAKAHSDLDLALVGPEKITTSRLSRLRESFEESNLSIRVDLLDWHAISESFQKVIAKQYQVIQKATKVNPARIQWRFLPIAEAPLEIIDGDRGVNYPKLEDFRPSGDCLFLNTGNVTTAGFNFKDRNFITKEKDAALRKGKLKRNDVVLTTRGTVGNAAFFDDTVPFEDIRINSGMVLLRADNSNLLPRFLFQFVRSPLFKEQVAALTTGSAQPQLPICDIRRIEIPLPPPTEQKAIATVLGALDDKIELNRRMNETLETMARTLFKSWFIDFDPVRAKLDGRQPVGLDPATAALFPESFQDSPIGPVPKGWSVERFDAHIVADRGLSYKGEGLRDDRTGLPMHNLNSIYEGGGYKYEGIKYYEGEYRKKHLVEPGDMIVTNTEQGFDHLLIGHAAIVPRRFGPKGIFSHHIYRVRFKPLSPFNPHYLVELFNNRRWHYWISGFANGTTINMLPIDALEMPLLVVPPKELVMKFTALTQVAHDQIENNIQQSQILAILRDTLLPKLLSGELSVLNNGYEL